uniref:Pentacotripeptide-repeat region of PRORP domain-containing protein n=1 Tax=Ditylum brightwellii TaxID=49249 RepID=A0A6U3XBE5_9STRA|mmetsp:Transcript_2854/g.4373  ORF Transcript_2854/g.4373 Transcript_2854/m.4373 type:complete len:678 (+) Transcript_2854:241-2274(+)
MSGVNTSLLRGVISSSTAATTAATTKKASTTTASVANRVISLQRNNATRHYHHTSLSSSYFTTCQEQRQHRFFTTASSFPSHHPWTSSLSLLEPFPATQWNHFSTQATSSSHDDDNEDEINNKEEEDYNPNGANPKSYTTTLLSQVEYNPSIVIQDVYRAARFNQRHKEPKKDDDDDENNKTYYPPHRKGKQGKQNWDVDFARGTVNTYERHLRYIHSLIVKHQQEESTSASVKETNDDNNDKKEIPKILTQIFPTDTQLQISTLHLLSSKTTSHILQSLLRCNLPPHILSQRLRSIETLIGNINCTPLNSYLSLQLLKSHGLAGNVGRTFSLLHLRTNKGYKTHAKEFEYCIQSIVSATLHLRQYRNVYIGDAVDNRKKQGDHSATLQSQLEVPTRWLDDILLHMSLRRQRVLDSRNERHSQKTNHDEEESTSTEQQVEEEEIENKEEEELTATALNIDLANRMLNTFASTGRSGKATHFFYTVKHGKEGGKIKTKMVKKMPPYYKVPSQVKDKLMQKPSGSHYENDDDDEMKKEENSTNGRKMTKLEWELERDYSLPLTSAFAFADSLTHGACGHDPIKLNVVSYNTLIKACCYRGALWRAMNILNVVMPRNNIEPDSYSYNTILSGLARVGDIESMKELLITMTNKGVSVNAFTVQVREKDVKKRYCADHFCYI